MPKLDEFLSLEFYNPLTLEEHNMNKDCDHDYKKEDILEFDNYAKAKCNKCRGHITVELGQ